MLYLVGVLKKKKLFDEGLFSTDSSLPVLVSIVVLLDAAHELEKKTGELLKG